MDEISQDKGLGEQFAFPVSSSQKQLWFLQQLIPDNAAYNVPAAYRVKGDLQIRALEKSLERLVSHHEILRSHFEDEQGVPTQIVQSQTCFKIEKDDFSGLSDKELEDKIAATVAEHAGRVFELKSGPLFRMKVVQIPGNEWLILLCFHHIIVDQISLEIFSRQLADCYGQEVENKQKGLPEPALDYVDYTIWQQDWASSDEFNTSLSNIATELTEQSGVLALPGSKQRPSTQTFKGAEIEFQLPSELTNSLKSIAQQAGVSLFTVLISAYQVLLARYAGQNDVILGVPFANRLEEGLEDVLGYFINTLPFSAELGDDPSFKELLSSSAAVLANLQSNQAVPLDALVGTLNTYRDASYSPLIQHGFTFQAAPMKIELRGLEVESLHTHNGGAKFDSFVFLWEEQDGIHGLYEYAIDLFEADDIDQIISSYQALLQSLVVNIEQPVSNLELLLPEQVELISRAGNGLATDIATGLLAHHLFEAQVIENGKNIAVCDGEKSLSYEELDQQANKLAQKLLVLLDGQNLPIGIYLERSLETAVAVLAVLKTGNACLPLDPSYPQERLQYMLDQSGAKLLVSQKSLFESLTAYVDHTLVLDEPAWQLGVPEGKPSQTSSTEELAYVLFTSGSTGLPKGVGMPHRAITNLVHWQLQQSNLGSNDRTLQFAPLSFDVSFQEMFATWAVAGTLVLVDDSQRRDPAALFEFICDEKISRIYLPFVALQQLADSAPLAKHIPSALREVYVAGEQLVITSAVRAWFTTMPECRLMNHYGPTETHVVTSYELEGSPDQWPNLPPIGKPLANSQIAILDRHQRQQPINVAGELWVGGEQVASGYLGREDLTAERFVLASFNHHKEITWYRTGDLARLDKNGDIEFLGRADDQVKFRGYRIELGEIENVVSAHPAVDQSAAVIREIAPGSTQLLAYYLVKDNETLLPSDLKQHLATKLPEYMVPQHLIALDELPLTASGKLDRKALPQPQINSDTETGGYVEPSSPFEQQIAKIWEELLGLEKVGITDDFFDLGGHSLLAVQLFSQLGEKTGKNLPLATLFSARTVAQLAIAYGDNEPEPEKPGEIGQEKSEEDLWDYLVSINESGKRSPLYCFHGVGGNVLNYYQLTAHLSADQPLYGLQCKGLDGLSSPFESLEEMTSAYVETIREAQPNGPYLLAGGSMGGNLAFIVAGLLEQMGEDVGMVVLFDTFGPSFVNLSSSDLHGDYQTKTFKGLLKRAVEHFKALSMADFLHHSLEATGDRATAFLRLLRVKYYKLRGQPLPLDLRNWYVRRSNLRLLFNHQPVSYSGKVVLLRCPVEQGTVYETPDLGWNHWVNGELEIVEIQGTNHSDFIEANDTGVELNKALEFYWKKN